MGVLQQLDRQQIAELADNLLDLLPKSAVVHNIARMYLEGVFCKIVATNINIYAYNGNLRGNTCLIAIRQVTEYYKNIHTWVVFAPSADLLTDGMLLALEDVVDWTRTNSFTAVSTDIGPKLREVLQRNGNLAIDEPAASTYYMDSKTLGANLKENTNDLLSNGKIIQLRRLDVSEAEVVVKYWKYAREGTLEEVRDAISFVDSIGLLVDNELVSWAYAATDGAIHALYTKEEHRGKGYGRLALRELARSLATRAIYAITQVEAHNLSSHKLMIGSGFTFSHNINWTEFEPSVKE